MPYGEEGRQEVASSPVGNQAVVQKVTIVGEPANYSGVSGLVISSAFGGPGGDPLARKQSSVAGMAG